MNTSSAPLPAPSLMARLSGMMFLQYAIWGAWLPFLWSFLSKHRGMSGPEIGDMFAIGAVGAIVGPFIAGPEGVELFEVMMGDPRSFPADTEGFEKLLAEKDAKRLPNPPIEMPDWIEDTRN